MSDWIISSSFPDICFPSTKKFKVHNIVNRAVKPVIIYKCWINIFSWTNQIWFQLLQGYHRHHGAQTVLRAENGLLYNVSSYETSWHARKNTFWTRVLNFFSGKGFLSQIFADQDWCPVTDICQTKYLKTKYLLTGIGVLFFSMFPTQSPTFHFLHPIGSGILSATFLRMEVSPWKY